MKAAKRTPRRMRIELGPLTEGRWFLRIYDRAGRYFAGSVAVYSRKAKAQAAAIALKEQIGRAIIVDG